eukprot:jgi/Ulvmu1/4634/UM002_0365.1
MAPKPKQAGVTVGPLVYISYVVSRVSALTDADQDAPECTVTLRAPTLDDACISEPCALSDVGSYPVDLKAESKHPLETIAGALGALLNGFVSVEVSISNQVVASAKLDLLPLAQGSESVQARLKLTPSVDSEQVLLPHPNVTVAAHLTRDADEVEDTTLPRVSGEAAAQEARTPFRFLNETEVSESTVASIICTPVELPPPFLSASGAASGGMQIRMGIMWLDDTSAHGFSSIVGMCDGDKFLGKGKGRSLLRTDDFLSLQDAAASGHPFYVEMGRYLEKPDSATDPAFANYHAIAALPVQAVQALQSPGCKTIHFELCFNDTFSTVSQSVDRITSVLPPRPPDVGKVKPVQAPLPATSSGIECCGWEGVIFSVEVTFTRAVLPGWSPPPKPAKALLEVLPERHGMTNAAGSAVGSYKAQLQRIAARLLKAYRQCSEAAKAQGVSTNPECLQQRLVFELNRSGLYMTMKEQLRSCVQCIGRDKFDAGSTDELIPVCSKLYACMLDELHAWLKQATGQSGAGQTVTGRSATRLQELASECELVGEIKRATQLHAERLLVDDTCAAWCAWARFCFRQGDVDKGEACLRQALSREPSDLPSLVALACVCWYKFGAADPMYMDDALALVHEAIDKCDGRGLPWALLTMLIESSFPEDSKATETRNAQHEAQKLASNASEGPASMESMPFLELESLLIDLQFGDLALRTHNYTVRQPGIDDVKAQVNMCKARAMAMTGDVNTAASILKNVIRGCGPLQPDQIAANVLLGQIHEQAGQPAEAQAAFEAALSAGPQSCPLEVYLKLGEVYLKQNGHQYAADVYMQACCTHPCASSWLGLGIAYMRLGRLADADIVLSEANTCDDRNSLVWGHLGLVHVLVENHAEAGECLESAKKHGLKDLALLQEIGEIYAQQGRFHEASVCLQSVVADPKYATYSTFAMLGDSYAGCHEFRAAKSAWANALAVASAAHDLECAKAAMSAMDTRIGDTCGNALISSKPAPETLHLGSENQQETSSVMD